MSRSRVMFCSTCRRKRTFDRVVPLQQRGHSPQFVLVQVAGWSGWIDPLLFADLVRDIQTDTVKVGQRVLNRLSLGISTPIKRGMAKLR